MTQPHRTVMVRFIVRVLVPMVQLYGLYVIFHGHYSPGGGFQGGVIIASAYIMIGVGLGREALERLVSERGMAMLAGLGVAVFALVGAASLLFGAPYLDYGALPMLGEEVAVRRSFGILLVEIGVAMTVTAAIVLIFLRLAGTEEV